MTLASRLFAPTRRPTWRVTLGGTRWRQIISLSTTVSYGQGISAGSVEGFSPPVDIIEGETPITWEWGYDNFNVVAFTGIVTRIVQRSYPNRVLLTVSDPLWRADIRRGDVATTPLNDVPASAAIQQILEGAGLTRFALTPLAASGSAWAGSEWVLGTKTPVSFANTTRLAAAQRIAEALGYWLHCDAGGTVKTTLIERRPTDAPFRILKWGEDFTLTGPPDRTRDAGQVRNRVVVTGAETGVLGTRIKDIRQSGDGDREVTYQNELIEYGNAAEAGNASAELIATRLLRLWSRPPNVITIGSLPADPRLSVGVTVAIECAPIAISTPRPFFIYAITTTLQCAAGSFTQSLTLDGGIGDEGWSLIPNPEAGMTWEIVKESLNGAGVTELFLDGTASASLSDGEIVSWAWSTATPTYGGTPNTATGPKAVFIFPAATTTATVTLTVTDTSSKTDTITQDISLAGDDLVQPSKATISLALGSAWAVTPNGGETWNTEATGDATFVPESGPLIATRGTGSTGLRQTLDALVTQSTNIASFADGIRCISHTPNTERVWVGTTFRVWRSVSGGASFTQWGSIPGSLFVNQILEDPAVENSVFVLAGANLWWANTINPGTAWAVLFAGPTGATARHMVRGDSGATTWICYTGTFAGSPMRRVEGGISALFPIVSPPVEEIRAMALSTDETTLYAWDAQGRGWRVDAETGIATAIDATLDPTETAQHALHAPDTDIVYLATFGASAGTTYKYIPLADTLLPFYTPPAGQQSHRIGYGAPVRVTGTEILLVTNGVSPGGVYQWTQASGWVLRNTGLPTGWRWYQVVASHLNPDDWLLLGRNLADAADATAGTVNSGGDPILYRTLDAGLTWSPIATPLTEFSGVANGWDIRARYIGYDSQGLPWVTMSIASSAVIWRWVSGGLVAAAIDYQGGTNQGRNVFGAMHGQGGDVFALIERGSFGGQLHSAVHQVGATSWILQQLTIGGAFDGSTRRPQRLDTTTRRWVGISSDVGRPTRFGTYPSAETGANVTFATSNSIGTGSQGKAWVRSVTAGRIFSVDPESTELPYLLVSEYTASAHILALGSDDQTKTAVAALCGGAFGAGTIIAYALQGEAWKEFAAPSGTTLRDYVTVIVRDQEP